jgi:hypothetical protein
MQEDWAFDTIDGDPVRRIGRVLWALYHPQRFPERVLKQYRRALADERGVKPLVRGR